MSRLIDADELEPDTEWSDYYDGFTSYSQSQINNAVEVQAIRIPEGATNKDVFKAVFGYEPATDAVVCNKEDWCGASEPCNYCMSDPDNIGREDVWWNAPYKKDVEE